MNRRLWLGSCCAVVLHIAAGTVLAQANAATWGISTGYVTANQIFINRPSGSDNSFTLSKTLDLGTAWAGPYGSSPAIYGGYYRATTFNTSVTPDWDPGLVYNNLALSGHPTADAIRLQSIYSVQTSFTSDIENVVILFPVDTSLLNPGEYFTFGPDSQLTWYRNVGSAGSRDIRWLVVSNSNTYYVGPAENTTGTGNYTFTDPDQQNWATWTPTSDLNIGTLTYNVPGNSITQISHVGFIANRWTTASGQRVPVLDTLQYQASLQIIPEPATAVLLLAGTAVLIGRLRRRTE